MGLRNHCSTTELRRQGDAFSIVAYAPYATVRSLCAAAMGPSIGRLAQIQVWVSLGGRTVNCMVAHYQTCVTRGSVRGEAFPELAKGSKHILKPGCNDRHAVSPPLQPSKVPVPSLPKRSGRTARRAHIHATSLLQDSRPGGLRTGWPKATGCSWMTAPYRKETYRAPESLSVGL